MTELIYPHSEGKETYPIHELPNFLTSQEIGFFVEHIDRIGLRQAIRDDIEIAALIEGKLRQFDFPSAATFLGCAKEITVSRHVAPFHISPHKDDRKDDGSRLNLKKLIIYLDQDEENPDSGGTVFLDKHKKPVATVRREMGKAAIFDIRQLHKGQDLVRGVKHLIGARLLYT